jgi:putative heme-binding domain-containing protein
VQFLDENPQGQTGNVERGKQVFAKANCLKCHKFVNEGQGVGPDLTTVRRRFQRKEILEAIVFPSQVISDQYRTVTVATTDGAVYSGMPITGSAEDKLSLLLADASRLEIKKADIDTMRPARTSVMPEDLFKDLSLQEIADLFAFMETSKNNEAPAEGAPVSGGR